MKQFNLDEYLANPSKKVVTSDGRSVRLVCTDRVLGDFPVLALVMEKSGIENAYSYKTNGQYYERGISNLDLFFATERKEGWANLYRGNIDYIGGCVYTSKEEAEENKGKGNKESYVATVKIEWEE